MKQKVLDASKRAFGKGRNHEAPTEARHPTVQVSAGPGGPPPLPVEIWRKILGYTVRIAGSTAVDLEDPFDTPREYEESPDMDPGVYDDRHTLVQVNSMFRALVSEMWAEYIVVRCARELEQIIRMLKKSKPNSAGKRLGHKTRRIDLKIIGTYNVHRIAKLLSYTPNLLIFVNQNNKRSGTLDQFPKEMLAALKTYAPQLRRLDLDSINEAPDLYDLIYASSRLPHLRTLRLTCIHSYPTSEEEVMALPIANFQSLVSLSLGLIPQPTNGIIPETYIPSWDPFLQYLALSDEQLPSLTWLETTLLPSHDHTFFPQHGAKLRLLRTTTWSANRDLPYTLQHCPNLEDLVLAQSSTVPVFRASHPTLRRICITPLREEATVVPLRIFRYAVLEPLDKLVRVVEAMRLPNLKELRIRNVGVFESLVEHPSMLEIWWIRWDIRSIRFVDKYGKEFRVVMDRK